MRAYNPFLNMVQTTPSPKYFIDSPRSSEVTAKSPYIVIKGHPHCLTRGFDTLKKIKKTIQMRTVETLANERMERPMKMVFVQEYDPVTREYLDLGDFLADVDTGTLYNPFDGKCQSSTMIWMVLE